MQEFYSESARWLYSFLAAFVVIPFVKWLNAKKEERQKLVTTVNNLSENLTKVTEKIDSETKERVAMKEKLDNLDTKFDNKFEHFQEILTEVRINTAKNSTRLSE